MTSEDVIQPSGLRAMGTRVARLSRTRVRVADLPSSRICAVENQACNSIHAALQLRQLRAQRYVF